jgi:hypothetical protein
MKPVPLLIVGDAVSSSSGLGRITRDLAVRIHKHLSDVFRLATLGLGGTGSRQYPWVQYYMQHIENYQVPDLPSAVTDHFGGEQGIVWFIWDPSRVGWFVHPEACTMEGLGRWLLANPTKFKKWLYTPVDADTRNGTYPKGILETLSHFDRVLMYTPWASEVTGYPDNLPHGLDGSNFKPHSRSQARKMLLEMGAKNITKDTLLLGIVATNQARKDFGLGVETARILLNQGHDVHLWIHCDDLRRHWDIPTMLSEFGLSERNSITLAGLDDETLCWMYSACDVTLGIGAEGFGLPLAESLACHIPVVHGNYAGGTAIVPSHMRVEPVAFRYEGAHAWRRPVYDPMDWAAKVLELRGSEASLNPKLYWDKAWEDWAIWLRKGVED